MEDLPKFCAHQGIALLKAAVLETVRRNPGIITTDIDKVLGVDKDIGGESRWTAHAIANLLEEEGKLTSTGGGRGSKRHWRIAE